MQSSWYNRALRNASGVHVCGHKLKGGKGKCEREVKNGEKYCWQHESEKRAKKDLDKLMKRVKRRKSQKITMPRVGRRGGGGGGRRGGGVGRRIARQPIQPTTTTVSQPRANMPLPPTTTTIDLPKILRPGYFQDLREAAPDVEMGEKEGENGRPGGGEYNDGFMGYVPKWDAADESDVDVVRYRRKPRGGRIVENTNAPVGPPSFPVSPKRRKRESKITVNSSSPPPTRQQSPLRLRAPSPPHPKRVPTPIPLPAPSPKPSIRSETPPLHLPSPKKTEKEEMRKKELERNKRAYVEDMKQKLDITAAQAKEASEIDKRIWKDERDRLAKYGIDSKNHPRPPLPGQKEPRPSINEEKKRKEPTPVQQEPPVSKPRKQPRNLGPPLDSFLPSSAFGELNEKLNPVREGVKRPREEFNQPKSRPNPPQPASSIPSPPPLPKGFFGSTYVPPTSTKTFQEEIGDANKEMKRRERQERLRKAKERREGEKIAAEKFKAEKEENEARRERLRKEYEEEKAKEQKKEKPKKRTGAEKVIAEALHSFQNKEKGSKVSATTVKSAEKFLKEHNKGIEEGRMNALEYKPPEENAIQSIPKHRMTAIEKDLYNSQHMSKMEYRKSSEGRHEEYLKKLAGIQFPTPPPPPQSTVIKRRKLTHEESSAPLAIEHKAEEKQPVKKRDLSFLKVAAKKMKAAREEKEKEMRKNAIIEAAQKKFLAIHGPDWMSDPNLPTPSEERKQKRTAAKEKKNAEALPHVDIEKPYVRSKGVKQAVNHPYQYAPLGIETAQDKLRREAYGWPSPRDRAKWMMNEFRGKAKKEAPPFPPVSNSSSNVFFPPMVVNTKERPKAIMGPQKEPKRAALTTGPSTMERPEASKFVGSSNTPLVSSSNPYYKPYNERELAARVRRDSNGNILNMRELFGFDEMNRKNQEALHKLLSENKAIQKRYLALK